jgi:hypothetical protein
MPEITSPIYPKRLQQNYRCPPTGSSRICRRSSQFSSLFMGLARVFQLLKSPTIHTFFAPRAATLGNLNVTLHSFPPSRYSFLIPAAPTGPSWDASFLAVFSGADFFILVLLAVVWVFFVVAFSLLDFVISRLLFSFRSSDSFPSTLNLPACNLTKGKNDVWGQTTLFAEPYFFVK